MECYIHKKLKRLHLTRHSSIEEMHGTQHRERERNEKKRAYLKFALAKHCFARNEEHAELFESVMRRFPETKKQKQNKKHKKDIYFRYSRGQRNSEKSLETVQTVAAVPRSPVQCRSILNILRYSLCMHALTAALIQL